MSLLSMFLYWIVIPAVSVVAFVRFVLPRLSRWLDGRAPGGALATLARDVVVGSSNLIGWLRKQFYRLLDWWQHRNGQQDAAPAAPPRPAPAPQRPAGPVRPVPADPAGPIPLDVTPAEIPAAFAPVLAYISGFEAGEDADLMLFTRGLAAGDLAMADAVRNALDHCVSEIGLDPVAIQGMADYADDKAEHAQGAMHIWRRFATVYGEIQAFVASGGVLPKDGRFLTGEGS